MVHLDLVQIKFIGQGRKPKFKVTRENNSVGQYNQHMANVCTSGGLWRKRLNYDGMTIWPVLAIAYAN